MSAKFTKFVSSADAATQTVADVQALITGLEGSNTDGAISGILAAVTAASGIAEQVGNIANTGLALAELVGGSKNADEPASLEILLVNNTKYPIVPFKADGDKGDVSDYGDPVGVTESTTFLLTNTEPFDDDSNPDSASNISFSLMVNDTIVDLQYYRDSDWIFGFKSEDDDGYEYFDDKDNEITQLNGLKVKNDTSDTTFNLYTACIESNSGKIQLTLYSSSWD